MKNSTTALGNADPEFYSTREAAEKLGLSLGTVQKMVETGALNAWKTAGDIGASSPAQSPVI